MVRGVLCGVKEKRLRDGKKDVRRAGGLRTEGVAKARETPWRPDVPGSLKRKGEGRKERRYLATKGDKEFHIFDPETCLHVGKHDRRIGVVYRYRTDKWMLRNWDDDIATNVRRGIIEWDGEGGAAALRARCVRRALEHANIITIPAWLLKEMNKPGKWGSQKFWEKLVEAHKVAVDLGLIHEVMET